MAELEIKVEAIKTCCLVILNAVNDLNAADVCCFATKGPTKNLKKHV
jgi:prophage DNA circulation protein